jgi:hypothetical protein
MADENTTNNPEKSNANETRTPNERLTDAHARYDTEQRGFLSLPKNAKNADKLKKLNDWNNAARTYFSLCIELVRGKGTWYSNNTDFAVDCLKKAADHYRSVFEEAQKLNQRQEHFAPSLLKFKELQELVRKNEPQIANELRHFFIQANLATHGFDPPIKPSDEVPKRVWIPAIIFTAVLLAVFVALIFKRGEMPPFQQDLANKLFAVFAGLTAGFISGTALFALEFPKNKKVRASFAATAGLAMFAFVWVYAPYWFKVNSLQQGPVDGREGKAPASTNPIPTPQPDIGLTILAVDKGSPAASAGLKPEDVILEVDGQAINSLTSWKNAVKENGTYDVKYWDSIQRVVRNTQLRVIDKKVGVSLLPR